jgi:hypothetical protein
VSGRSFGFREFSESACDEWDAKDTRQVGKSVGKRPAAWDRDSYKKAWRNVLAVVTEAYPDDSLAGLWLRDLRKVAKTRMVRARVHPNVINAFLGHRPRAAEEVYFVPEFDDLKPAAAALALGRVFGAETGKSAGNSARCAAGNRSGRGANLVDSVA